METVNLFFSCDDHYVPFLAVTLASLKDNRDPARQYDVRILHTGLCQENRRRIAALAEEKFGVEFVNISEKVRQFARQLHTRDYYSQSTYYRLFIPAMFPQLTKGLYLDSDLVLLGDVSRLYDTVLDDELAAAIPDGIINTTEHLALYAEKRLGVPRKVYFNAGVLLMNLEKMRQMNFEKVFLELLNSVRFQVAQDQDYLNVICKNRVRLLDYGWNSMPTGIGPEVPELIHFNLDSKPWHRDDVRYGEYFWRYVPKSGYETEIRAIRAAFSQQNAAASAQETVNAIALAFEQAMDDEENQRIHESIARVVTA